MELKNINKVVRRLRIIAGKSQAQVAAEAGCSPSQINKLELYGGNMTLDTFNRVMKALGAEFKYSITARYVPEEEEVKLGMAKLSKQAYLGQKADNYRHKGRSLPAYKVAQILKEHMRICAIAIATGGPISEENIREYRL